MGRIGYLSGFFVVAVLGPATAAAQSAVSDEAVKPNGAVEQRIGLTSAQKSAIYNAVFAQGRKPAAIPLLATVGAVVPPSVRLTKLPEAATAGNPSAAFLEYATVDDDIVVVDPVAMCVVDIIHDNARP
jgi:Protein of unknown function (DUF1236)